MDEREELNRRAGEAETMREERERAAMPTEEVAQEIRKNLAKLAAQRDELQAQRDDLLAALKAATATIPSDHWRDYVREQARSAIARAEGEEPCKTTPETK